MLRISHWKAAAILFTVLVVSAMAIPNFLSEKTFQALPKWAQHRVVPGMEYQGGSRLLMEVNVDSVRNEMVERLHRRKSPGILVTSSDGALLGYLWTSEAETMLASRDCARTWTDRDCSPSEAG